MPYHLPALPMTLLACLLLLAIYLFWIKTRRSKRRHLLGSGQPQLPAAAAAADPPAPRNKGNNNKNDKNDSDSNSNSNINSTINSNSLSPKVQLLRAKLAIAMGSACPIHAEIKAQQPDALDEPWSGRMSGPPYVHVVLNNKTFAMSEVEDGELAARISRQPAIDAGENIKLYLNDVFIRNIERGLNLRPGQMMSCMQDAAGVSPHTPGFVFLSLVVNSVILKRSERL